MTATPAQTETVLINYLLQLGDSSLVLSHRLSELCGHAPVIEQDIALTNIALDLLGEARGYYQYIARLTGKTEDEIAFIREERSYRNTLITELANTDFAHTILRQFFFDVYHFNLLKLLRHSSDQTIAAIAEKSVKEAAYHVKWSAEWVIRLGAGTELSKQKMQTALKSTWPYTGELYRLSEAEQTLIDLDIIPKLNDLEEQWQQQVSTVLKRARLDIPGSSNTIYHGGKQGVHTEAMGYILSDLQYLQRVYPGLKW